MPEPRPFTAGIAGGALPIVGHAWPLISQPIHFLKSLSAYGDLVEIRLGPRRAYVPCHPDLLRQILTDSHTFDKGGPLFEKAREVVGNGLATCTNDEHRRQRPLLQPAFHRARLERYSATMEQEIDELIAPWHDGQVIDVFTSLYGFTLRSVTKTLFSTHISEEKAKRIELSFETALSGLFRKMFLPRMIQRLPLPANRRYLKSIDDLNRYVDKIILDYQNDGTDHGDLLSGLISTLEGGEGINSSIETRDQVLTMLVGGSETGAALLSWVLYALTRNPVVESRLHGEVDAVLSGRQARWRDLPRLPYTERVITEALRLYPPLWLLTRTTTKVVNLAGWRLPPDTIIAFSPSVVNRDERFFQNAEEFDPDRWLPGSPSACSPKLLMSFGAGSRKCIGDSFGTIEAKLALASIASRWRLECVPGTDARPTRLSTVYRPRNLQMRLIERRTAGVVQH